MKNKHSMQRVLRSTLLGAALVVSVTGMAQAEDAAPVRLRGTVASIDGDKLTVKTHDGKLVPVALKKDYAITGIKKADLADIKTGDFVGIASLPKSEGGDGALEVLIFPPAMKGTGEGSYGWDLKPNSTMTNGTVGDSVKSVDGSTVTVAYKDGSKKIAIPAGTPIVTFAPATPADLKVGAAVFVPTQPAADGSLTAARVIVGNNGIVPPM